MLSNNIYFMKAVTSQHAHKDLHVCIDCWLVEEEEYFDGELVEFYEEGKGGRKYQHCNRCKRCEDYYVYKFVKKYPGTKTLGYKFKELTKEDIDKVKYQQFIKKGNLDDE